MRSCIEKNLKLILKIFFPSKIGCKGPNYQSSALTISQEGTWKVSMFFSKELNGPVTNQSLQIRCYLCVYVF